MRLSTSNKGWHSHWFYVKNDVAAPLPEFIGRLIEKAPDSWRKWGVPEKDKKRIRHHLNVIRILKERGMKGSEIIGAYHSRSHSTGWHSPRERFPPLKWCSTSRR